ncbi:MAG: menaquinone biosynthesis protein [Spirochaetia bacterium]|nr:menaquinone biosynthesis protein [Spirochaetia bacterium]
MKIGAVSFLNAYPLYWNLEKNPEVLLVQDIPSRLAETLLKGELDAAIISSIEYYRHRNIFSYFPDLCISARGPVESIRLYMNQDEQRNNTSLEKWLRDQRKLRIFYDTATRSSLYMLKILLNEHCKKLGKNIAADHLEFVEIHPPFETVIEQLKSHELVLLIGDSALRLKNLPSIDMGELYYKTFQRAFVYAVWVYLPKQNSQIQYLGEMLLRACEAAQKNQTSMIQDAVLKFGFEENFTLRYLAQTIQYRLTEELKKDMNFFFTKYDQLPENLSLQQ